MVAAWVAVAAMRGGVSPTAAASLTNELYRDLHPSQDEYAHVITLGALS